VETYTIEPVRPIGYQILLSPVPTNVFLFFSGNQKPSERENQASHTSGVYRLVWVALPRMELFPRSRTTNEPQMFSLVIEQCDDYRGHAVSSDEMDAEWKGSGRKHLWPHRGKVQRC
jgi:hypothetical protein